MARNFMRGRRKQVSKAVRERMSLVKFLERFKSDRNPKRIPQSRRFCLACNKKRWFKYNPLIGHSRCTICGGSFATREPPCRDRRVWKLIPGKGIVEEKEVKG